MRADSVLAHSGRNDERLGIVNHKRSEGSGGAFHHGFLAFDEIQHVNCALSVVRDSAGKPMPTCFNELELVQASALFAPSILSRYGNKLVDEIRSRPFGRALPLDIALAMLDVNGPWTVV